MEINNDKIRYTLFLSFMIWFKKLVGKKPPLEIIVIDRFKELKSLTPPMLSNININETSFSPFVLNFKTSSNEKNHIFSNNEAFNLSLSSNVKYYKLSSFLQENFELFFNQNQQKKYLEPQAWNATGLRHQSKLWEIYMVSFKSASSIITSGHFLQLRT